MPTPSPQAPHRVAPPPQGRGGKEAVFAAHVVDIRQFSTDTHRYNADIIMCCKINSVPFLAASAFLSRAQGRMTIEITIVIRGSSLEDTEATGPRARIPHGGVGGAALGAGQSVPGEGARGHLRVPGAVEIPCCSPCLFQGNFPRGPCLAGPSPRATESLGFSSCFPGIEGRAGRSLHPLLCLPFPASAACPPPSSSSLL